MATTAIASMPAMGPSQAPDLAHASWPTPATVSGVVETFRDEVLPQPGTLAGYSAIAAAFGLNAERPTTLSVIGKKHRVFERDGWKYYTPRHAPKPSLGGHLTFALRYEGVNLAILAELFENVEPRAVERVIAATPTGRYARRIWFLYEWLMGRQLEIPSSKMGTYVPVIDAGMQLAVAGQNVKRHRARHNLLGTPDYCPSVAVTAAIKDGLGARHLDRAASFWASLGAEECRQLSEVILAGEADAALRLANADDAPGIRVHLLSALQALATPRSYAGQISVIRDALARTPGDGGQIDDPAVEPIAAILQRTANSLDPAIAAALAGFGWMSLRTTIASYQLSEADLSDHLPLLILHAALASQPERPHGVTIPLLQAMTKNAARYRELAATITAVPAVKNDRRHAAGHKFPDLTAWVEFMFVSLKHAVDIELPVGLARVQAKDLARSKNADEA